MKRFFKSIPSRIKEQDILSVLDGYGIEYKQFGKTRDYDFGYNNTFSLARDQIAVRNNVLNNMTVYKYKDYRSARDLVRKVFKRWI